MGRSAYVVSEKDLVLRVESGIVDVLDLKRGLETRASYVRRAMEIRLYGRSRTKPTAAASHRSADPFSRHRSTGVALWVQLRLHLPYKLKKDVYEHCRTNRQPVVSFIRQTILESSIPSVFAEQAATARITFEVPLERVDELKDLIDPHILRWRKDAE